MLEFLKLKRKKLIDIMIETLLEGMKRHKHFLGRVYSTILDDHIFLLPSWLQPLKTKYDVKHKEKYENIYEYVQDIIEEGICKLLPKQFVSPRSLRCVDDTTDTTTIHVQRRRDLLFFAIVCDLRSLATTLLMHWLDEGERINLIGGVLTCYKLLTELAEKDEVMSGGRSKELQEFARKCRDIANWVTHACYIENRLWTKMDMVACYSVWGKESLLVISSYLESTESNVFGIIMNDVLTGALDHDDKHIYTWISLSVIPIPIFPCKRWIKDKCELVEALKAYYTAPATKFTLSLVSYVTFILLFSMFLLTDFHRIGHAAGISVLEILVTLWIVGLAIEEIRQIIGYSVTNPTVSFELTNLKDYYISNWNAVDMFMISMYFIGFILRCTVTGDGFYIARFAYCISMIAMYVRLLWFATLWQYLGPIVSMIQEMMIKDLPPFIIVLSIFIWSFGVAYHSFMNPNTPLSWQMLMDVISHPYWQIYGEIQLDELSGIGKEPEPPFPYLVHALTGVFMIIASLLIVNLVIAVFNHTYDKKTYSQVERYNRLRLVEEYISCPVLPSPLNVLELTILLIKSSVEAWKNRSMEPFRVNIFCKHVENKWAKDDKLRGYIDGLLNVKVDRKSFTGHGGNPYIGNSLRRPTIQK